MNCSLIDDNGTICPAIEILGEIRMIASSPDTRLFKMASYIFSITELYDININYDKSYFCSGVTFSMSAKLLHIRTALANASMETEADSNCGNELNIGTAICGCTSIGLSVRKSYTESCCIEYSGILLSICCTLRFCYWQCHYFVTSDIDSLTDNKIY